MIKQYDVIFDATFYVFTEPDSVGANSYYSTFRSSAFPNDRLDFSPTGQQWNFNVTRDARALGVRIL